MEDLWYGISKSEIPTTENRLKLSPKAIFLSSRAQEYQEFALYDGETGRNELLVTPAKIVIRVVDAATNNPIRGASVAVSAPGYSKSGVTNQSGEARLSGILVNKGRTAAATVSSSASGYSGTTRTITIQDSSYEQYFTIALNRSGHESPPSYTTPATHAATVTVSGRVYDRATNESISMAGITISASGFSESGSSDGNGNYSISNCPSDRELRINSRKTGYRAYAARLPILGSISHYTHNIPLDKFISPAPEDTGYDLNMTEPQPTKELEYIPGVDTRKFKPREEKKEESQFVEKRAPSSGADDLEMPIIADFAGGIVAIEDQRAVVYFDRSGALQWKFPDGSQGEYGEYTFFGNDISDHGEYLAASGSGVLKFASGRNIPVWRFSGISSVFGCVAISGNGRYVVAGNRAGCVYLFVGDEAEINSDGDESRGSGRGQNETLQPEPVNVYKWKLEEGGHFINKVDISYDGKYIAVGSTEAFYLLDRDVFISAAEHEGASGCVWHIPVEEEVEVEFISISDDGMYVAANTGPNDGVLYVCSRNSGRPLWSYRFESFHPASSVVSGDGNYVVLGTNKKVYEFSTTGGNRPIWSCKKSDYQSVVDTSYDGKYVYAHKGYVGPDNGWHDRTYLWDRAYFMRRPYSERPFKAYDSEEYGHPWVSMSETGDILVFLDGNRLRVEKPTPRLLLDIIGGWMGGRAYCPELPWCDEQKLRVFITNPGQAVSGANLKGVLYLPLAQFAESYFELATSARDNENEPTTVDEVIGQMAVNLESSVEVFNGTVFLAEHSSIDKRLQFDIPKLFDLPIVTWGMTAALLSGRSYTDFENADLVGWGYSQLTPVSDDVYVYRFIWESEPGTPPVIPPEEPPEEEPPTEPPPPGGGQPQAVNLDLRPVKITFNDGTNEYDATGVSNPALRTGTRYTVKVEVKNEGPEDLRGISIPVKITTRPETRELSGNITHIPSGETRAIVYPNVTYDAGSYTFFVLVDSDEVITESGQGQNNNLMQGAATFGEGGAGPHADLPDLNPEALTINGRDTSSRPRLEFPVGDYRFRVVVINSGEKDLEERTTVKVTVDKVNEQRNRYDFYKEQAFEIDALRRGGIYIKEDLENISFEPGKYRFIVNVDPELRVAEVSDDNNTFEGGAAFVEGAPPVQPEPELPDLQPVVFFIGDGDAMGLRNPVLAAGEQYRMRISVANLGNADLRGVQVPIDISIEPPTAPLAATIDSIPVGETRDAVLDVSFGEGSYTFNIAVNQGQAAPESNIDNNRATGTATFVTVVGPGVGAGPGAGAGAGVGAGAGAGPGPGAIAGAGPAGGAAQGAGGFQAWVSRLIPQWAGGTSAGPQPARGWPRIAPGKEREPEREIEVQPVEIEEGPIAPSAKSPLWLWILVALYVYCSLTLHVIAVKTKTRGSWLAWIPIASLYLMCKIARKPGWWFWLLFIPLVNIVIGVIVWIGIAKARRRAGWLGLLILAPIVNLAIPGYLAFSK